jgi:hypothetical protein
MGATAVAPITRFMRFVDVQENGCWLWTGHTAGSKGRRPMFRATTKATDPKVYAHIFSYEHWNGPVPEGLELDHFFCDNRMCVNPDHVEPKTHEANAERTRLSVCSAGLHDLNDPQNIRWDAQGRRRGCLPCWLARARERYAARRGGQ